MSLSKANLGRRVRMHAALNHARNKNQNVVTTADLSAMAYGTISFAANPANSSTITLGGTVVTFGTDVAIGANLAATLATLLTFLKASANANIVKSAYDINGSLLTIRYKTAGVATFTLAASAATRSGPTLTLPNIRKRKAL
jgi:hypothetical protein